MGLVQTEQRAQEPEVEALANDGGHLEQPVSLVGQLFGAPLDGG